MFAQKPPIRFAEPGTDPTNKGLPLEAPRLSGCLIIGGIALAMLFITGQVLSANGPQEVENLPTVAVLPSLTPTLPPSHTPRPVSTWTPLPTYTQYPTYTRPASTSAPTRAAVVGVSLTQTPMVPSPVVERVEVLVTWTPGPWLLTRFHATLHPTTPAPEGTTTPTLTNSAGGTK